jgi:hypothetical protein
MTTPVAGQRLLIGNDNKQVLFYLVAGWMLARGVRQPALATPGISAVLSLVLSNDNKQVLFFMVRSFIYPSVYSCRE